MLSLKIGRLAKAFGRVADVNNCGTRHRDRMDVAHRELSRERPEDSIGSSQTMGEAQGVLR